MKYQNIIKMCFYHLYQHIKNTTFNFDEINNTYSLIKDSSFYLKDTEIKNIFDYFEGYKIPSLMYYQRNPSYIDIDYKIKIVRYDAKYTILDTNKKVFDIINEYFKTKLETFNSEYLNATVIKRINETTTDISGLNVFPTIRACINRLNFEMYNTENNQSNLENVISPTTGLRYVLHLSYGYDYPFTLDYEIKSINLLPQIDTEDFIGTGWDLYVDWSIEEMYYNNISFNIKSSLDDSVIGKYIIVRGDDEYIRVELYTGDLINLSDFDENKYLNIKYLDIDGNPSDNFQTIRNSVLRLSEVKYII